MQEFAKEYIRLVRQIRLMGKTKELGSSCLDAVLAQWSTGKRCLPARKHKHKPKERVTTIAEPVAVLSVTCQPEAPEPAGNAPTTPPISVSVTEKRVEYAMVLMNPPSSVRSHSGTGGVQIGNMVTSTKKAMPQPVTRPATVAVAQGPPPKGLEQVMVDDAIPPQGEPNLVPEAPNPESTDPGATVHGMMVHLTQMVDLMLAGPLASLCKEVGLALQLCFTDPSPPK